MLNRLASGSGGSRQLPDTAQPLGIALSRLGPAQARIHGGPHTHDYYLVGFVERGGGTHTIGEEQCRLGPGGVFTVAPGDLHDARGLGGADGWLCIFARAAVPPPASGRPPEPAAGGRAPRSARSWLPLVRYACLKGGSYEVPVPERDRWSSRFSALDTELYDRPPGYADAARAWLALLVIDVARMALPRQGGTASPADPVVADVMAVIDRRFADKLSLADVARELARSPNHLARIVKAATGETVMHWIHERRMVAARLLLVETSMTVDEIAQAVGYHDRSYFTRRFRASHATSPQGWRQRMRLAQRSSVHSKR